MIQLFNQVTNFWTDLVEQLGLRWSLLLGHSFFFK
jgi:hypothetical protein